MKEKAGFWVLGSRKSRKFKEKTGSRFWALGSRKSRKFKEKTGSRFWVLGSRRSRRFKVSSVESESFAISGIALAKGEL